MEKGKYVRLLNEWDVLEGRRPPLDDPQFARSGARASFGPPHGRERAMSVTGWRLLSVILAYVLQTALLCAALPANPDEAPAGPSLAGQLLVAAPSMGDPHFERTVILIVKHDRDGAVGIVINKLIGETSIASVFEALGQKSDDVAGAMRVFSGGPVQPELGLVVHSVDYHRPETIAVNDRVSMTSSLDILRDIAAKKEPAKILVAFGYAGWGPDQLEREIQLRAWGLAEADLTLIFDEDRDKVWDHAWGASHPAFLSAGEVINGADRDRG
jgi:putative transcriptional regulator